jgi:hypothetical protein
MLSREPPCWLYQRRNVELQQWLPVGTATVSLGGVSFTRVLAAVDTSVTNMKTLTVTISWSEGTAGNRSIAMKTSIASGT